MPNAGQRDTPSARALNAVVSYPGVMPAVSQVARAFLEADMLGRYETTFVYCADARLDRVLCAIATGLLGSGVDRQLARRALVGIPENRVQRAPAWDLLRTFAGRMGADDVVSDRLWQSMISHFDDGVARRLERGVDLVYGYERACLRSFERAAELGAARVFDMAAAHHSFADRVSVAQAEAFPEIVTPYWRAMRRLAATRNAHAQAELDCASLVIANSTFTARTLLATGYPADRVRVIPLGAPPVDGRWRQQPSRSRMRFLFAGSISPHKGAHHLLAAWRALGNTRNAELVLAGRWALPERLRGDLPSSVTFVGHVPQNELFALYRQSSALVFPSLCDGFAMVVTEALAHGLPVITTESVGASDLLREGVSGWVLPSGDQNALAEKIAWCIDHPQELHAMREHAEATAAAHPWSEFRRRLVEAVRACAGREGCA